MLWFGLCVGSCLDREWVVGGGGGWHKASVLGCLAAPIGLSPLLILTLCGSERVLVLSTEPLDDLSCLTTSRGRGGGGCECSLTTPHAPSPEHLFEHSIHGNACSISHSVRPVS